MCAKLNIIFELLSLLGPTNDHASICIDGQPGLHSKMCIVTHQHHTLGAYTNIKYHLYAVLIRLRLSRQAGTQELKFFTPFLYVIFMRASTLALIGEVFVFSLKMHLSKNSCINGIFLRLSKCASMGSENDYIKPNRHYSNFLDISNHSVFRFTDIYIFKQGVVVIESFIKE